MGRSEELLQTGFERLLSRLLPSSQKKGMPPISHPSH